MTTPRTAGWLLGALVLSGCADVGLASDPCGAIRTLHAQVSADAQMAVEALVDEAEDGVMGENWMTTAQEVTARTARVHTLTEQNPECFTHEERLEATTKREATREYIERASATIVG